MRIIYLLVFLVSFSINGQLELNNLFSDNMVLQRNSNVNIWGKTSPNQVVKVYSSWNNITTKTKADNNGDWLLKINTSSDQSAHQLVISTKNESKIINNVLLGEVWFGSGQSNMQMTFDGYVNEPINDSQDIIGKAKNGKIRLLTVERKFSSKKLKDFKGKWELSNPQSVRHFSAAAYSFASYINETLNVPVGIIVTSWGGTPAEAWAEKNHLDENFKSGVLKNNTNREHYNLGYLFNGMINPLIPYTIKGALWYQGENNRLRANNYSKLMQVMVESWRNEWGQGDFPFYFVQIAPFRYDGPNKTSSALLRDSQLDAMHNIVNSGMVSTVDIGDLNSIHPPEKIKVGNRLAYWALNKTYGFKSITPSGPIVKSAKKNGSSVIISFDYAKNGFYNFNGPLKDFELSGDDNQFYKATAKISGRSIIVESDKVSNPSKVRYGWKNYFEASLFNLDGLPASSFQINNLD
tara:strand:+ start:139 stop:1533 length:1395 start_codon:yes stop_codon:yes gene_type:complete